MKTLKVKDVGRLDYQHECGGQMMVDGTCTKTIPLGCGFRPGVKGFVIDHITYKGFYGQCLDCGASGAWYVGKGKTKSIKPRSINRKLEAITA